MCRDLVVRYACGHNEADPDDMVRCWRARREGRRDCGSIEAEFIDTSLRCRDCDNRGGRRGRGMERPDYVHSPNRGHSPGDRIYRGHSPAREEEDDGIAAILEQSRREFEESQRRRGAAFNDNEEQAVLERSLREHQQSQRAAGIALDNDDEQAQIQRALRESEAGLTYEDNPDEVEQARMASLIATYGYNPFEYATVDAIADAQAHGEQDDRFRQRGTIHDRMWEKGEPSGTQPTIITPQAPQPGSSPHHSSLSAETTQSLPQRPAPQEHQTRPRTQSSVKATVADNRKARANAAAKAAQKRAEANKAETDKAKAIEKGKADKERKAAAERDRVAATQAKSAGPRTAPEKYKVAATQARLAERRKTENVRAEKAVAETEKARRQETKRLLAETEQSKKASQDRLVRENMTKAQREKYDQEQAERARALMAQAETKKVEEEEAEPELTPAQIRQQRADRLDRQAQQRRLEKEKEEKEKSTKKAAENPKPATQKPAPPKKELTEEERRAERDRRYWEMMGKPIAELGDEEYWKQEKEHNERIREAEGKRRREDEEKGERKNKEVDEKYAREQKEAEEQEKGKNAKQQAMLEQARADRGKRDYEKAEKMRKEQGKLPIPRWIGANQNLDSETEAEGAQPLAQSAGGLFGRGPQTQNLKPTTSQSAKPAPPKPQLRQPISPLGTKLRKLKKSE